MKKQYFLLTLSLFFLVGSTLILRTPHILNTTKSQAALENFDLGGNAYVTNSIIVKYKDGQDPVTLQAQARTESVSVPEKIALRLQNKQTIAEQVTTIEKIEKEAGIQQKTTIVDSSNDVFLYKNDGRKSVRDLVEEYAALPQVEYVQPDYIFQAYKTPNDAQYSTMWSLAKINMPAAWEVSTGSNSVLVADIDTGAQLTHPDLQANVAEFKNFSGCPDPDSNGHGTHTAGTIGAVGNNGQGITGISWNVKLLVLKADCRGFSNSALISSINYAVQKGAKVINMSLGGPGSARTSPALASAIASAVQQNVVVVAAAGNDGRENANGNYPASDPNVIAVSATGPSDELATYSSYGTVVDVAAPGGNAPGRSSGCTTALCPISTWPGGYKAIQGTSMAAPHVTGLVGLMFAVNPNLTAAQVKQILESSAKDLGTAGKDNKFGAGRIDAKAALDAIVALGGGSGSPTAPPTGGPTPPSSNTPTPSGPGDPTIGVIQFTPHTDCTDSTGTIYQRYADYVCSNGFKGRVGDAATCKAGDFLREKAEIECAHSGPAATATPTPASGTGGTNTNPTAIPPTRTPVGAYLQLNPSTVTADIGDTVQLDVIVNAGGAQVLATDVQMRYDKNYLEAIDIIEGNYLTIERTDISVPGQVYIPGIVDTGKSPVTGTGKLATVLFKVKANGSSTVSFHCLPGETANDSNIATYKDPTSGDIRDIIQCSSNGIATVSAGKGVVLNLALKFQGINAMPARNGGLMTARVGITGGELDAPVSKLTQLQADNTGTFFGSVEFPDVSAGRGYRVLVKGPTHIQKKICHANPLEQVTGEYRCVNSSISLKNGDNDLDFSSIRVLVGDVDQNGIVNSFDLAFVYNSIKVPTEANLEKCDVNWDGVCNGVDYGLMGAAIAVKTEDE